MPRRAAACLSLCIALLLAPAGAVQANHKKPRFEFGDTDCIVNEFSGIGGIGLATDIPRVYAKNYRHGIRDKQRVAFRSDLYQWQNGQWIRVAKGNLYRAVASDNNYAIAWWNTATRQYEHFPYERHQWTLQQNGYYRVMQRILWYRPSNPTKWVRRTPWTWVHHSPRAPNGGDFCFVP